MIGVLEPARITLCASSVCAATGSAVCEGLATQLTVQVHVLSLATRKLSGWARKNPRTVRPSGSSWMAEHAKQVLRQLPDGITVLVFFLAQSDSFLEASDGTCT